MDQSVRTCQEVHAWLERHGVTAAQWARANGFEPTVVYSLLNGRTRGRHGQAYAAAIALGLKPRPEVGEELPIRFADSHSIGSCNQ